MLESRENLAYPKGNFTKKIIIILFIALFFMYCIFFVVFLSIISFYFVFDLSMMITNLKERVKGKKRERKRENSVFIFL